MHVPDGQSNRVGLMRRVNAVGAGVRAIVTAQQPMRGWVSDLPVWFPAGGGPIGFTVGYATARSCPVGCPPAGVLAGWLLGDQGAIDQADWRCSGRREVAQPVSISGGPWPCSAGWRRVDSAAG